MKAEPLGAARNAAMSFLASAGKRDCVPGMKVMPSAVHFRSIFSTGGIYFL